MPSPHHPGLAWVGGTPEGRRWLDDLPRLVERYADEWSLELGRTYEYAFESYDARVRRSDGSPAVLKIGWPNRESEHEAPRWPASARPRLFEYVMSI